MKKKRTDNPERDEEAVVAIDEEGKELDKVKKINKRLAECLTERKEYLEGWQRAKADHINTRNSLERSYREKVNQAGEEILLELIPTLDSFEMAFSDKAAWEAVSPQWRKGVEHIHAQLLTVLANHNIELINPGKVPFDPEMHESVDSIVVNNKDDDGMIMNVLQQGYILGSKVVRPAKVHVGVFKTQI